MSEFGAGQEQLNPLVVDVDGTLVRSNLLIESAFSFVAQNPLQTVTLGRLLLKGKAPLKAGIAERVAIDVRYLPYDGRILERIEKAKADGRPVYLVSAANERYIADITAHLGLDGWFASDGKDNLRSKRKAERVSEAFGQDVEYLNTENAGLTVHEGWRALAPWIRLLRVHQWAKNALVFLPVLTAHELFSTAFPLALLAFLAFSLAASAVYIVNDLVDIEADRKHRTKRRRPLAAGTVPLGKAIAFAFVLAAASIIVAAAIGLPFLAVLAFYLALTTAYSFSLKRKMLIDVVTLAALYTVRVLGGAAATSIVVSVWLLGFSLFIFTSLALIKRYVELAARADANLPNPTNRDYQKDDLSIIAALSAAAGFNAVTVFAMYVSSDAVTRLYSHPQFLWLACPLMIYWIGRALIMAHRRMMDDDPIIFALRDRGSIMTGVCLLLIIFAAK